MESPLICREMSQRLVLHFTSYVHVLCYRSHTVCLHLLVLYCNNRPSKSTCVHLHFLFIIILFLVLLIFFFHPFLHLVFCENDPLAGPTLRLIDVACLITVFLFCLFFAHAVPKFLKYKRNCHWTCPPILSSQPQVHLMCRHILFFELSLEFSHIMTIR